MTTPATTGTQASRSRRLRRSTGAALVLTAGLTTAACTNGSDAAEPIPATPSASSNSTSTEAPTPSPTQTPSADPTWMAKYSDDELRLYDAALLRLERYEQLSEPIWSAGISNEETEAFFQEWWSGSSIIPNRLLDLYESANAKLTGIATVLDSRASRIVVNDESASVSIRQCVDPTTTRLTQNGKPARGAAKSPRIRVAILSRLTGDPFTISRLETLDKRC